MIIGVLAYRPKAELANSWQPLADYLSQSIPGCRFKLITLDYEDLQKAPQQNLIDFVLTNPSNYIALQQRNGLSGVLATLIPSDGDIPLSAYGGVFITRSDRTDIRTLKDLVGRTIGIAHVGSFGGYQAQVYELLQAGLPLPTKEQMVVSGMPHDVAVEGVIQGKADVGFVRTGVIEQMTREGKIDPTRLKIINRQNLPGFPYVCSTRLYPEWAFVALSHVDKDLARMVASSLLGLEHDAPAMKEAKIHGFDIPANYAPVETLMRELRLPPFEVSPKFTLADVWNNYRWQLIAVFSAVTTIMFLTACLLMANRNLKMSNVFLKRAKSALKESEENYRTLVNAIPHGITVMDQEYRIVTINAAHAKRYQHPPEWFVGRHCYEIFKKRDQICPHCPGVTSLETGEIGQIETEGVCDDGSRIYLCIHTTPYTQANGTAGFIEIVEDITERKRLEASAQQMTRLAALGEMASGVAHEINNPITGIIACGELLQNRLPSESSDHGTVDRIVREGDRIAKIVNSLLSVAHPGQAREEVFSIHECLDPVITLHENRLEKAGIDVSFQIADDLPLIRGDRQKIEQLLMNLISNAHYALNDKFPNGHPDKRLSISAQCRENAGQKKLCLEIYDQGIGIPDEMMTKIFDPFFTTKPAGIGTGLGLAISFEIVRQHGGEIRVDSQSGRYTRFTVELPTSHC